VVKSLLKEIIEAGEQREVNKLLNTNTENNPQKIQILLTNDDGIQSPGLWAAAEALSEIGYVHVVAPREQYSGGGRSMPVTSDGRIGLQQVQVNGQEWQVYSVGGSPAQAVLHAILEILPQPPGLVVSGINYGENMGTGITVSGTVGAAMEAAALGFPALAVSLETDPAHHLSYSTEVAFAAAAHFTVQFARLLLRKSLPPDVHLLKVDVPAGATPETPWVVTRLSQKRYYEALAPERQALEEPAKIGYRIHGDPSEDEQDTDVYALKARQAVSVTPLSLDLTSRVSLPDLETYLKKT
jgi:5'-nucleotidase